MFSKPEAEHQWFEKLVGKWTLKGECPGSSEMPPFAGTEVVRSLGGLWYVAEGVGDGEEGAQSLTQFTLGYDPVKRKYVGTFHCNMMAYQWVYEGEVDSSGKRLVLDTEGPACEQDSKEHARYQDIIEIVDDNTRTLTSRTQGANGDWQEVMKITYRRQS